ncbi:MAG: hypothetical protein V3U84_11010 [Thiotrichaceae bacterium]
MPFKKIEVNESIPVLAGSAVPVSDLLAFLNKHKKDAKATFSRGYLCVKYKRDETPEEKAVRVK